MAQVETSSRVVPHPAPIPAPQMLDPEKPKSNVPPRLDVKFPILGFLMEAAMSGYDLKRRFRESVGFFYRASDGSLYPALRTLAAREMVKMRLKRTGGRTRKLYAITSHGRRWFLTTLAEPSPPVFVHDESSVKLYFAHHRPEVGLIHLRRMREHNGEMAAFLGALEDQLSERQDFAFRRLVVEIGKRIMAFRAEMLAELEDRLGRELKASSASEVESNHRRLAAASGRL